MIVQTFQSKKRKSKCKIPKFKESKFKASEIETRTSTLNKIIKTAHAQAAKQTRKLAQVLGTGEASLNVYNPKLQQFENNFKHEHTITI